MYLDLSININSLLIPHCVGLDDRRFKRKLNSTLITHGPWLKTFLNLNLSLKVGSKRYEQSLLVMTLRLKHYSFFPVGKKY